MSSKIQSAIAVLKSAADGFMKDDVMTLGASLAYYAMFSISPLLIISIAAASAIFGAEASRGEIFRAVEGFMGADGAKAVEAMVQNASAEKSTGIIATILGAIVLLFAASGAFGQLQSSLNLIWKVRAKPGRSILTILRQRFLSISMVAVIALLLLISLIVTAAMAAINKYTSSMLPGGPALWEFINVVISFIVSTALFATVFKLLPDVKVPWRDVIYGALITALLFTIGKFLIGMYLGRSGVATSYGAAGSLVIVLIWVYYSSLILFFGAEITRAYSTHYKHVVEPKQGAEFVPQLAQDDGMIIARAATARQ